MRNQIEFEVYGKYALFTDPLTKIGGEKFSYQIPTYEAIKGIVESIYWKPTLIWYIDEVRVMNPIQTESKGIRPIAYSGGNTLAYYTYLRDVRYQVRAHFEFNMQREELRYDRNEHKHHQISLRAVRAGGRRDIFLGTRECQGYVEPCVYGSGSGAYDEIAELDFGVMLHGITYPDEGADGERTIRLWQAKMKQGHIVFPRPDHCTLVRRGGLGQIKRFGPGTMQDVDALFAAWGAEGGGV